MGAINQTDTRPRSRYAAFWFYRATEARFELEPEDAGAIPIEMVTIFEDHALDVNLRAAYSTIGFSATVDLILWVVSDDLRKLHALAADLHASAFSAFFELVQIYNGSLSTPGAIFRDDISPKSYLSVRFVNSVSDEQGRDEPEVVLSRFDSFGTRDRSWVLALEADHPITLMEIDRRLGWAGGQDSATHDAAVILGLRLSLEDAIAVAL